MAIVAQYKERIWEAELYRVQGEILRVTGAIGDAPKRCFRHALHVARAQKARSLALRASMSLVRLLGSESGRSEICDAAYAKLASEYGQLTEGFDTVDLREAADLFAARQTPTVISMHLLPS